MGRRASGDGPRHKDSLLRSQQLGLGGHVSPRGPGLQLPGARQLKPGNQIRGAQLGEEAGLGTGPEEPRPGPQAAPTFLSPPRPCSPDGAQPSPGVAATPSPQETTL